jgi:hypothetical protein
MEPSVSGDIWSLAHEEGGKVSWLVTAAPTLNNKPIRRRSTKSAGVTIIFPLFKNLVNNYRSAKLLLSNKIARGCF